MHRCWRRSQRGLGVASCAWGSVRSSVLLGLGRRAQFVVFGPPARRPDVALLKVQLPREEATGRRSWLRSSGFDVAHGDLREAGHIGQLALTQISVDARDAHVAIELFVRSCWT